MGHSNIKRSYILQELQKTNAKVVQVSQLPIFLHVSAEHHTEAQINHRKYQQNDCFHEISNVQLGQAALCFFLQEGTSM